VPRFRGNRANQARSTEIAGLRNERETAVHPQQSVRAADSVLDHAKKTIEIEDIYGRVSALEEAAKDQNR
jgi:hypothetical protein